MVTPSLSLSLSLTFLPGSAVSSWPLTAEGRVRPEVSPCGIYGGQSGTRRGLSLNAPVRPVTTVRPIAPLLTPHLDTALTRKTNGKGLANFQKQKRSFGNREALGREVLSLLSERNTDFLHEKTGTNSFAVFLKKNCTKCKYIQIMLGTADNVLTVHRDKLYKRSNVMHLLCFISDNNLYVFRIVKLFIISR